MPIRLLNGFSSGYLKQPTKASIFSRFGIGCVALGIEHPHVRMNEVLTWVPSYSSLNSTAQSATKWFGRDTSKTV